MSFLDFLKQAGKVMFGFGGGSILFMMGVVGLGVGETILGAILLAIGILLLMFGVYSRRQF